MTKVVLQLLMTLALAAAALSAQAGGAAAETRRAFLVGIQRYSDPNVQPLTRSVRDAQDLGKDLEQVGFDKKNITVVADPRNRTEFDAKFNAFVKTIQKDDVVLFFFSGHGIGVDIQSENFLLFGDLRSLFSFARNKVSDKERKDSDIVRLRMNSYADQYETEEVAKSGISVTDIQNRIAERRPRVTFMILDACRTLAVADANENKRPKRSAESGSRLVPYREIPKGFLLLFSASFGEQAVESFGPSDKRRNSVFTEVLRSELFRPGQTLIELGDRVRLVVRAVANGGGQQQEPELVPNLGREDEFTLIDGIGAERFTMRNDACEGSDDDLKQIMRLPRREDLERHRRRFAGCRTAEQARWTLANLSDTTEEVVARPVAADAARTLDDCDRLAASSEDGSRPPDVPGVRLDQIDADAARPACRLSISRNPRITRFLFNLGRAEQAATNRMRTDDPERKEAFVRARLAFDDAQKRGYVPALNNLAILYDNGFGVEQDSKAASELLKKAAQQGFPLAMYNLGLRYASGEAGIQRDLVQAYEWHAKAAESGFQPAMIEVGAALWLGRGVQPNPRRGLDYLQRAADLGSARAKLLLGFALQRGSSTQSSYNISADEQASLLWFARAAEAGEPSAYFNMAEIMENGSGLSGAQPELAERYYRLAAASGNREAEVTYAERLGSGRVLAKTEDVTGQRITLLKRALSQGSTEAAAQLARIYRTGEGSQARDPVEAIRYAFRAIKLATESDPTQAPGNPFYEIGAGILLVDMTSAGDAVSRNGQPLFTPDEIDRLKKFYGRPNAGGKEVKVRQLVVPLRCGSNYVTRKNIWVWDWGREEAPTEPQFRTLERVTNCTDNQALRETLVNSFQTSRKNDVAFADLIDQQIKSAKLTSDAEANRKRRR